jgi:predicted transposase/invertase (TIGR01784 family)
MFDDVINSEIDEWLYVMKHSEIRKGFKSPYMTKVAERLSVIKMSSEERNEYIYYQKQSVHSQDILSAAEAKGEAKGKAEGKVEGKAEGRAEEKIEIARAMLLEGDSIEKIAKITGLSIEEIEKLLKKVD